MSQQKKGFTISEEDLAKVLEISLKKLDEVIQFFDSIPDDQWEIKEGTHYVFENKTLNERRFSELGAFAIAKYLDETEPRNIWQKVVEFLTQHQIKLRQAFIRRKIYENKAPIIHYNQRLFITKKSTVAILCTSYARLNSAFDELKRSEKPLIADEDFTDDLDGVRLYSFGGFYKLSSHLGSTLTKKDRRTWCKETSVVAKKEFKRIEDSLEAQKRRVDAAKVAAKKRDKNTCQITGRKYGKNDPSSKTDKVPMAAHHIFSQQAYPHLADSIDNLITLKEDVHKKFHQWMSGSHKPCTIDDLIDFATEIYPEEEEACSKLLSSKLGWVNRALRHLRLSICLELTS